MKTYKNLDEIYEDTRPHQVTVRELLNGRTYFNGHGERLEWGEINMTPELRDIICRTVADKVGGYKETKDSVFYRLKWERPQHWGLDRFVIEKYSKDAYISYIAGQDMPWEMREIRKSLKR